MENSSQEATLKMFEQAMAMSKAFGGEKSEASSDSFDMQKMAQAMQMFQLFKNFNSAPEPETVPESEPANVKKPKRETRPEPEQMDHQPESKKNSYRYFDDEIHTAEMRSIKAAIPYLDQKYRKRVGIFVKMLELQKLLELYSIQATSLDTGNSQPGDWRRGMLRAIHPHMANEKKHMVEMLLKCIDIQEIMLKMKEVKQNDNEL